MKNKVTINHIYKKVILRLNNSNRDEEKNCLLTFLFFSVLLITGDLHDVYVTNVYYWLVGVLLIGFSGSSQCCGTVQVE